MLVVRVRKVADPLSPVPRVQGMATADAKYVEGNRKGAWVEASEGAGYEVAVDGKIRGGSFGGPERHKGWVHWRQASTPGGEAGGRDGRLRQ